MATAWAHTNIALVKYWGKRSSTTAGLNLPATGSLSMTLDGFGTTTTVALQLEAEKPRDSFVLDDDEVAADDDAARRVFELLDVVAGAGRAKARVTSRNQVPTAAGLASSASAFAALALAASSAYGTDTSPRALSILARRWDPLESTCRHASLSIL